MIITPAPGDLLARTGNESGKHQARLVLVGAQFRQVIVHGQIGKTGLQQLACLFHRIDGLFHFVTGGREFFPGPVQHIGLAVESGQFDEHLRQRRIQAKAVHQGTDLGYGLALQCCKKCIFLYFVQLRLAGQPTEDPHMAQIQEDILHPGGFQGRHHQAEDFDITLHPGMTVQLRADLQRAAAGGKAVTAGTEHAADVAQAVGFVTAQLVGINTGRLGRDIRTYTQQASADLVGHLEGLAFQVLACTGKQGIQVFDEGGDDQLIAPAAELVQQTPPQGFQASCLIRQQFIYAFG